MKKALLAISLRFACIFYFFLIAQYAFADQPSHYVSLLKEMFTKVTLEKNDKAIPIYYSKDFKLYSNGKTENFGDFLRQHQAIYKTPIQYKIRYEDKTFIEQGNKVAGRLFITTQMPNEPSREIEVILIAEYRDNKLYRVWELTYPDWTKMKAFKRLP